MGKKVLVLLLGFPLVAWGQAVSGSWTGEVSLVPTVALVSTDLELSFSFLEEWTLSSSSEFFGYDGWVWQEFNATGVLGFLQVGAYILFGPKSPAFLYAQAHASFSIADLDFELYTASVGPDTATYFSGGPSGGAVAILSTELDSVSLRAELGMGARLTDPWAPFTITYIGVDTYTKSLPIDPFPGGMEFTYLELSLKGLSICCGISHDVELSFTKQAGFNYIKFSTANLIQLCCDIAIDVSVTFTTSSKSISLEPHWQGIEGCVEVYGDIQYANSSLDGLELYGFRVFCELEGCYSLEILTSFRPDLFYVVDDELLVAPLHVPYQAEPLFKQGEFEYVKISACGAACCGGTWTLNIWSFFRETSGTLFGLSRILIEANVPLMENFYITPELEIAIPGGPSLSLGWVFSF